MRFRRILRITSHRPKDVQRDVDEEIAFHLAMREQRLRARGLADEDAVRQARSQFGDINGIRDECLRESHTLAKSERAMLLLEEFLQDVRFALRSLLKTKAFTLAVIITLALGIGANTTLFSLINAVVLQPIKGLYRSHELFEFGGGVSFPLFRDLSAQLTNVALAGISERTIALGNAGTVERSTAAFVSGSFFRVTGVGVAHGRVLGPADDVPGAPPVVMLTHAYWASAHGSDPSILGKTITVNATPVTVVGVAARGFRGMHLGEVPDVWIPLNAFPAVAPNFQRGHMEDRGWEWISVIGRPNQGVEARQVESAMSAVITVAEPTAAANTIAAYTSSRPAQSAALPSDARTGVIRFAMVLAMVVALVLLTACANIAGLMLARAVAREREIGLRIALGAGRSRLIRQLITEALVIAALGGSAGIAFFVAARAAIQRVTFPGGVSGQILELSFDQRLLWFAIAITLATAVLVGLVPALQSSRTDTAAVLKGSVARGGSRQQWLRSSLTAAQVAIALVLLVGTGLFARALDRALAVDLGFNAEPLALLAMEPGLAQIDRSNAINYYLAAAERARATPGVNAVTWTTAVPLTGGWDRSTAEIPGYVPAPDERVRLEYSAVGPRYHEIVDMPLLTGRGFDERDAGQTTPVMIINETAAKRYFGKRAAIGATVRMQGRAYQVIGVVRDAKYHELNEEPRPYAYFALLQTGQGGVLSGGAPRMVVRTAVDPASVLPTLASAIRAVNPAVPIVEAVTARSLLRRALAPQLAGAALLGVFSMLALVVAAVGIYGLIAFAVSQRTREIGIRLALGARPGAVLRLMIIRNLALAAAGVPIGVALAITLGKGLTGFLYGVGTTDPATLISMSAVMLLVALLAAYLPARRAVRADPLQVLRADVF